MLRYLHALLMVVLLTDCSSQEEPLKASASGLEDIAAAEGNAQPQQNPSEEIQEGDSDQLKLALFPVQESNILLNVFCEKDTKLEWSLEIESALKGLKKGDEVIAFAANAAHSATLGDPACLIGTCGQNYVGVSVISNEKSDAIVAVGKAHGMLNVTLSTFNPIQAVEADCNDIYEQISHPEYPEVVSKRGCESFGLQNDLVLTIAKKGFEQENGWNIYPVKGRVGKNDGSVKGAIFEVDMDTSPLEPQMGFGANAVESHILWKKASGICCPSRVTVQLSHIDASMNLVFGESATAGGQPCD